MRDYDIWQRNKRWMEKIRPLLMQGTTYQRVSQILDIRPQHAYQFLYKLKRSGVVMSYNEGKKVVWRLIC